MAQVKNKATGEVTEVPDDEVGEYAVRGFLVPKGTKIPVMVGGGVKTIDVSMLAGLSEKGGRVATAAQVKEFRDQREFGEGVGAVRGGAEALARGGTLGLSDVVQQGLGIESEGLKQRQERLGGLGTALEVAGAVAPTLLSGGTSVGVTGAGLAARAGQAARVIGAPARAAATAGRATEAAVAGLGGGGRLAKTLGAGTGAALEGAVYGAGQAASEAALNDSELTGEQLLAHMGTGAIFGGGAGTLLKGGQQVIGAGVGRLRRVAAGADEVAETAGGLGGVPIPGVVDDVAAGGSRTAGDVAEEVSEEGLLRGFAREVSDDTIGKLRNALKPEKLKEMAAEFAFASGRGRKKFQQEADRFSGSTAAVGQDMLDEIPEAMGKRFESLNIDDLNKGATIRREHWGSQMGKATRDIDNAIAESGDLSLMANGDEILARIQTEIVDKVGGATAGATGQRIGKRVLKEVEPFLEGSGNLSITDLKKFQTAFKNTVGLHKKGQTLQADVLLDTRNLIEGVIEKKIAEAEAKLGIDSGYKLAKGKWSSMKTVEDMTADTIDRDGANRFFSLTDYLGGGVAANAFGMGPAGLLLGLAGGVVNKFARKRGSGILAGGLSRFSHTREMAQAAQKVNNASEKAADSFFDTIKKGKPRKPDRGGKSRSEAFKDSIKETSDMAANPAAVAHRVNSAFGEEAANIAPRTTQSAIATATRAVNFLASKNPVPPVKESDVLAHTTDRQRVSDSQQAKYMRYAEAVRDPMGIVEDFGNGTVSREAAEVLRTVYPELFATLEKQITDKIIKRDKPLPYKQSVRLGLLLGRPMHPHQEPEAIAAFQAVHAKVREDKQDESKSRSGVPDMAASKPTEAQRLTAGAAA